MNKAYIEHPVFEQLSKCSTFYENLAFQMMSFVTLGIQSAINIDMTVYDSMQGTLESISDILRKGRVNDAYALLRKYYDAAIINIYTNIYLDENVSIENFVVEKIENWLKGEEQLPPIQVMNTYIEKSSKAANIYKLLHKDKRYSELKDRCNDNMHYNFYHNVLLNNTQTFTENRVLILNRFSKDLENIFILHLSYLFSIKEQYMTSSDYVDALDSGTTPEPDSQYFVAPFIQEVFDSVIKKNRNDLATEIKSNTSMQLK